MRSGGSGRREVGANMVEDQSRLDGYYLSALRTRGVSGG
jgi:hypothetical protein